VLQLRDAGGNPVALAGIQVTASVAGPTLAGATATTDANGVAAFTGLALTGLVGNYTLVFTAANVANTASSQITLAAGPATQLTFTTAPPATAGNGQPFSPAPALQLRDASGNAAAQSGVTVSATIASGQGGTLSGTLNIATNASGVATFTNLAITGPLGDYTLTFTAAGLTPATSGAVKLVAGPPAGITLTTQPSASARNDEVFPTQPVVVVKDAGGNLLVGVTVLASIGTGPAGTLGGIVSLLTDNSGTANYNDLELIGPVGSYTLSFTAGSATLQSNAIALSAGIATSLELTTGPPANWVILLPMIPAPVVELRDSAGNLVPTDGVVVNAVVTQGGGVLTGTTSVATVGGVATFSLLSFISGSGNQRITFSSPGLSSDASGSVKL
jgi:hypothetical protein